MTNHQDSQMALIQINNKATHHAKVTTWDKAWELVTTPLLRVRCQRSQNNTQVTEQERKESQDQLP